MNDTFYEDNFSCAICKKELVPPVGNKHSDILLVAEYPGEDEINNGKPMSGSMGIILRTELMYLGFDIKTTSNLEAGDELKSVYGILKVDKATKQKGLYRVKFFGWSFNLVRSSLLEANWIKK